MSRPGLTGGCVFALVFVSAGCSGERRDDGEVERHVPTAAVELEIESEEPAFLYTPRPRSEWTLTDAAGWPAVVVIVDFSGDFRYGNGVIIEDEGRPGVSVLTCHHVIENDGRTASHVRVGILAVSFAEDSGVPDYQELPARIAAQDGRVDLALLQVEALAGVASVALPEGDDVPIAGCPILSISPFGRPSRARGLHPPVYPGQSGSPEVCDGVLVAIVRASFTDRRLPVRISAPTIRAFLASVGEE